MDIQATLERLSGLQGPSGYEHPVAEAAVDLMRPLLDEANVDRFGNAVGVRLCGKPGAPRLLLDAHLDEVGLMVTGIEEGFLRFRTVGGVDPRMLPDRELTVLTDPPLFGVVASHLGIWLYPAYLMVFALLMLILSESLNRTIDRERKRRKIS